ncbi:unnamed protein product, partial [Rotaria sp. Silwood2]
MENLVTDYANYPLINWSGHSRKLNVMHVRECLLHRNGLEWII